ncbi:hypothetical protein HDU79_000276 [Rhizoclosmatium sp. JEL0117]|nr:hypothetical protein HDU79_000276 [Rhizoclosmatium sp. JEL0117]
MQVSYLSTLGLLAASFVTAADVKPIPVGGICGSNNSPACESNLDCIPTNSVPGTQGICTLKQNDIGGECSQDFPNSAICKSGLICVPPKLPADDIPRPGTPGTCQLPAVEKPIPVGGVCGGQTKAVCESNLDCVSTSGINGAQGVCTLKQSDIGGECKQNFPNSAVCKSGLVCILPSLPAAGIPRPGTPGTCQLPVEVKPNPVGGICGGTQKLTCESNLDCITATLIDGAQGICALKQSDVGGQCVLLNKIK